MKRRTQHVQRAIIPLFSLATVVFLSAAAEVGAAEPATRPNVLFLMADQWRAQATGYAGDPNVKTPHLDRLAARSANFVNAVSGLPVCSPCRASLLTGQRPLTHGVFLNDVPLNPRATTIAKVLKMNGYDTGFIGKWHVDGHGRVRFIPPERRQGFDYWKALECTHDYNNSVYYADGPTKRVWPGYDAFAQTEDARRYLRAHAKGKKPFALFVSWGPPHNPYPTAPRKYRAMYDPARLKLRANVPAAAAQAARRDLAGYYGHCTALDACVGELWKTLREAGIEENTLLVFTSDHGDMLGSHNLSRKQKPWDEAIRVPLVLHLPRQLGTRGRKLTAPINTEDLMPTMLGLCGVAIPRSVEGIDYSGHARGEKNPSDSAALITCVAPFGEWTRGKGGREFRGVRSERYTYVRDLKGPWLLYDNEKDPYQLDNLVGKQEHTGLQAKLDRLLRDKLKRSGDAFRPGAEYIKKWGWKVDASGTVPVRN
jgi:arylsulfatase A-like enzyme